MQSDHLPAPPRPPTIITRGSVLSFTGLPDAGVPLAVMSIRQDDTPELHEHDFIELVYVRSGSGYHRHERHRYPIFAGDCFVIAPGERHGYDKGRNLEIINVLFYPILLEPFKENLSRMPGFVRFFTIEPIFRGETAFRYKLHIPSSVQRQLTARATRIMQELTKQNSGYQALCSALLVELLVLIGRGFDSATIGDETQLDFEGKERTIASAISFLEQNYGSAISVAEIAHSSFVSPSHLSHVFRDVTGMSLIDYLTKLRLDHACRLLADTGKTIESIAFELGFHDPSYFGRTFKARIGISPLAFRRRSNP